MAMATKYEPQARYDATHTVRVALKLNRETDADILAKIREESADIKSGADSRKAAKKGLSKYKVELSKRFVFAMASVCSRRHFCM